MEDEAVKRDPRFADERPSVFAERRQLLSRDLCQNLLYPAPQITHWVKPAGALFAIMISMEDENVPVQK
jgi:hypothetical protein